MNRTLKTSCCLLVLYGLAPALRAADIYVTGFEPPTFSAGAISGQDSWLAIGTPSSTVVETTTFNAGVQAVGVTPLSGSLVGALHTASYNGGRQILTFGIDAYLSASGTPSFWTVMDTQYNNTPANIDLNVDASGQMHVFVLGTDYPTGVSITRGVWNHYELDVNFSNSTVQAYYNGALVLQDASFVSRGTTLAFFAFYSQPNGAAGTDAGYFDNVSVTAGGSYCVPGTNGLGGLYNPSAASCNSGVIVPNGDTFCGAGVNGPGGIYNQSNASCNLGVIIPNGDMLCAAGANGRGGVYNPTSSSCDSGAIVPAGDAFCPAGANGLGGVYNPSSAACNSGAVVPNGDAFCPAGANGRGGVYNPMTATCNAGAIVPSIR